MTVLAAIVVVGAYLGKREIYKGSLTDNLLIICTLEGQYNDLRTIIWQRSAVGGWLGKDQPIG